MKIFLRSTRSTRGRKFVLRDAAPRFREVPLWPGPLPLSFNPVNRNICSTGALETFFSPPRHNLCVRTERALCPLDGKNTNHFVNRRKFIFLLTSLTNMRRWRNSHKNFSLVLTEFWYFFRKKKEEKEKKG